MKILLNLLPEEKKSLIQRRLRTRFLIWQLFLLFIIEVFVLTVMGGIYVVLDGQLKGLQNAGAGLDAASSIQEQKLDEYEAVFRDVNAKADKIGRIRYGHTYFTGVFLVLDAVVPEGISLETLDTKGRTIMLTGQAKTRDSLLAFGDALKGNDCVESANLPISNLFSQTDIEFQLDFVMKENCLHKR